MSQVIAHLKKYSRVVIVDHDDTFFHNISLAFASALQDVGINCQRTPYFTKECDLLITFGYTQIPPWYKGAWGIYQTEQYNTTWFDGTSPYSIEYMKMLKRAVFLIDYSERNMEMLKTNYDWIRKKSYYFVPFYYHPSLDYNIVHKKCIDVLLMGSGSARRLQVIESLKAAGLNAVIVSNVKSIMEVLIGKSKICINMHYDERYTILETSRISWLLACNSCVVSERGEESSMNELFAPYVTFVENLDEFIPVCKRICSDDQEQEALAHRSEAFKQNISLVNFFNNKQ
jgi:hypothetical protein